MICAITGDIPKEPVVSPKSGAIFDRVHVVNYIATRGKDPINDEPLKEEELITITSTTPSITPQRITNDTSIPSLLSAFQNEWDSLALELFTLRKELQKAKQELSAALYHQDAAVRVAARAIKERDEAKNALLELTGLITSSKVEAVQNLNISNIPAGDINQAREELFKLHKAQKPTYVVREDENVLISFIKNAIKPFEKANSLHVELDKKLILCGSESGSVCIYDIGNDSEKFIKGEAPVCATSYVEYNGEGNPITSFSNSLVIGDHKFQFKHIHSKIIKLLTHPKLKNLFIIVSEDSWSLNDVNSTQLYISDKYDLTITTGDIHFDGALIGTGDNSGFVKIFNLSTSELVFKLESKYNDVRRIKFAFNGYWLLILSSDNKGNSCIEILDLRKNIIINQIECEDEIYDFMIDPSSSFIVSCHKSNLLKLHRFIKKGKSWENNISEIPIEESESKIQSIELITSAEDDVFVNNKVIKFIAMTENSSVLEYQISCQ